MLETTPSSLPWPVILALVIASTGACSDTQAVDVSGDVPFADAGQPDADLGPAEARPDAKPDAPLGDLSSPADTAPPPAATPPFTPEEAARACVRLMSCLPASHSAHGSADACLLSLYADGPEALQFIVGNDSSAYGRIRCLAQGAGGCAAVRSCLGAFFVADWPELGEWRNTTCVEGDLWSHGTYAHGVKVPCAEAYPGSACQEFEPPTTIDELDAWWGPRQAGCTRGVACPAGVGDGFYCAGDVQAMCVEGLEVLASDCSVSGLVCREGRCAGRGAACSRGTGSGGKPAGICAGQSIVYCAGFHEEALDCRSFGADFTCETLGNGARCQRQGPPSCQPSSQAQCQGQRALLCNAGAPELVDCAALGFGGCLDGLCVP